MVIEYKRIRTPQLIHIMKNDKKMATHVSMKGSLRHLTQSLTLGISHKDLTQFTGNTLIWLKLGKPPT